VGPGSWAGAPSALYHEGAFYVSYRLRRPRDRGYESRIAVSSDGLAFRDVWRTTKAELSSPSIERCALVRSGELFRLYVSYVDGREGRWRIDMLEASAVDRLDPARRRAALLAPDATVAAVKDPIVTHDRGVWHMLASCAIEVSSPGEDLHRGGDAFATGRIRSATGLATSEDGAEWRWVGIVLSPPSSGWDAYETRLSCVLRSQGAYLGLYDGIATVDENYEERTGIASSTDLRAWQRLSLDAPALVSPYGSRSLRYVSAIRAETRQLFYAETARADGSHELRVFTMPG
jgi:hypothetical protein